MADEKKDNLNEIRELMDKLHDLIEEAEGNGGEGKEWMTEEQKSQKNEAEWEDFLWDREKKRLEREGPIRIWLVGTVREEMNESIVKKIRDAADYPEREIELYVSTYGGSVYEMIGICDAILAAPNHVRTIGSGKIMSAGGPILACGDERVMTESSFLMIHDIWSGSIGSPSSIEADLNHVRDLQRILARYLSRNSDLEEDAVIEIMEKKKDSFYSAQEALEMGIIDYIEGQEE